MTRYVANKVALRGLLRGDIAQRLVTEHTGRITTVLGEGYGSSFMQGRSRYRGIVFAKSMRAKVREARENNLLRVLG